MPPKGKKLSQEARAKISAARSKPWVQCTCLNCGKIFEAHPSEVKRGGGKFCNKDCEGDYKRGVPRTEEAKRHISESLKGRIFTQEWRERIKKGIVGKQPSRKGEHHTEETKQKLSKIHTGMKASSETKVKMSEKRRGSLNPAWMGGVSFGDYCPKFNREFRERVRAFFKYTCLGCGALQKEERLTVHHVLYNKKACCDGSIPMFAPLCRSCHGKTNHNRKYWENYYAQIIQEKYNGKSFLTKEEMLALK